MPRPIDHPDPHVRNAKRRLQRTVRKGKAAIARDVQVMLDAGVMKPLDEWDLEELAKGKPRSPDGKFHGPAPKWIDDAMRTEITRRLREGLVSKIREHAPAAIDALWKRVIRDPEAKPRDVNEAVRIILEYSIGKPAQAVDVNIGQRTPLEMLADIIVLEDGQEMYSGRPTIDGELVEDDDDLPPEPPRRPRRRLESSG